MPSPARAAPQPSRRAAVACKACNLRKVRCTVTLSGAPCANCVVDDTPCEVANRKRRRNTDLLPSAASAASEGVADDDDVGCAGGGQSTAPPTAGPSLTPLPTKRSRHQAVNGDASKSLGINSAQSLPAHTLTPVSRQTPPSLPEPSDCTEDSSSAYAETLEGGSGTRHGVPFYPGMNL